MDSGTGPGFWLRKASSSSEEEEKNLKMEGVVEERGWKRGVMILGFEFGFGLKDRRRGGGRWRRFCV